MGKEKILILGSRGLLGTSFRKYIENNNINSIDFIYGVRTEDDIESDKDIVFDILNVDKYDDILSKVSVVINCVAYTDVDKAETDELNFKLNADAVGKLANKCKEYNIHLIHFSTDFVFSGFESLSYFKEIDLKYAGNKYGKAKSAGERLIEESGCKSIIFRVSWLYSEHKSNFITKFYDKLIQNQDVNAINDIVSGLTYADDLVGDILDIILSGYLPNFQDVIFHYRNDGDVSVYDIAMKIKEYCKSNANVIPVSQENFQFKAKRPSYSSLVTTRFEKAFKKNIPCWDDSLIKCLDRYQNLVLEKK